MGFILGVAVGAFLTAMILGLVHAPEPPKTPPVAQTKAVPGSPAEKRAQLEKDMATFEIAYDNIRRDLEAVIKEAK